MFRIIACVFDSARWARHRMVVSFLVCLCSPIAAGSQRVSEVLIDDRSTGQLQSSHAGAWRLITDQVMGGRSSGELVVDKYQGRECLRMHGSVSTANNGGFVQMALDLADRKHFDPSKYAGLVIEVAGNGQRYNLHLRTTNLWLPWQSYRAEFAANAQWKKVRIPFSDFEPYRTSKQFDPARLIRIGVVAIGRDFDAEVCVGSLAFYRDDEGAD
jgi:hypothetical protein